MPLGVYDTTGVRTIYLSCLPCAHPTPQVQQPNPTIP